MKKFIIILFICVSFSAYADGLITDAPKNVREYENFYIKLKAVKSFTLSISNDCLKVSGMEGVKKRGDIYSSAENGKISFDNLCFEKDKVTIEIKANGVTGMLKYRIAPKEITEPDFGC